MLRFILRLVVLFAIGGELSAAIESYHFESDEQRIRYQQLTEELRCPKCQNQNLADSDSQIAEDLRRELHQQLLAGKTDEAIVDFMRERYGDFVLYKPRFQRSTLLLWIGPILLVFIAVGMLFVSRRSSISPSVLDMERVIERSSSDQSLLPPRFVYFVSLFFIMSIAIASLLIYRQLGSLQALQITDLAQKVYSGSFSPDQQIQQQELLLLELDEWLLAHPDDDRFIYMRARLLSEAGIWDRAVSDYSVLVTKFPEQDNFLSEYAQVLFLQNNRTLTPDAFAFLKQALEVNPHNVTALGLLGMAAFEQKDYRSAVDFWQRLLRVIPAGSPQSQTIAEGVARAREQGGLKDDAVSVDIRLTVQVTLGERLEAKPDETVFVLLRAVNGSRMPLAAVKTTVSTLATPMLLDTASSPMRGQIDLTAIDQFEVVARLSRSGQPVPSAGDWEGVSEPFARRSVPERIAVVVSRAVLP